jgi:hypothetical protein
MYFVLPFLMMNAAIMAQTAELGIRAGVNMDKLISTDYNPVFQPGFVAGAYFRIGIGGFFLEPNLIYSQSGGKVDEIVPVIPVATETRQDNLSYLELPILFGKRFAKTLRISIGPSLEYLLGANETITGAPGSSGSIVTDVKNNYKSATVGFQVGAGIDILRFGIDLRYDSNLSGLVNNSGTTRIDGFSTDTRSSIFQLTVSYKIL